jgi:DNA-binding NarL/FixJ family response regulator
VKTVEKVNVVIADDHAAVRIGLRQILERSPIIIVLGEACNGKEAIQLVDDLSPDVLILDLQMPIMDGFETLAYLHKNRAELIILILSANNEKELITEVISMGAWGYYLKEEAPDKIVEAVHQASMGNGKGHLP